MAEHFFPLQAVRRMDCDVIPLDVLTQSSKRD